jgi:TBC1 domain family protein 5
MHELLAPLYYAVNFDAIFEEQEDSTVTIDSSLKEICSALWIAADAWGLFDIVMRGVSRWYEWREPEQVGNVKNSLAIPTHVRFHVVDGQGRMQPYVAPIVQTCSSIQGTLLRAVDPRLYKAMQNTGIEPQIYGM